MNYDTDKNLTNHPPESPVIIDRMENVRYQAKELAKLMDQVLPDSRERATAFIKLEETVMWAIASLARNQDAVR